MSILKKFIKYKGSSTLWANKKAKNYEYIISSRIRIARNIADFPFPGRAKKSELRQISNTVRNTLARENTPQHLH